MRIVIIVVSIVLLLFVILGWFLGLWMDLTGARLWIFRGGFWLISIGGAAFALWFFWTQKKNERAKNRNAEVSDANELGTLIREVRSQLGKSRRRLGELPVVFILGDTGSAKTSSVVNSGLNAEPLAGLVYKGPDIVPTPTANFWFGGGTVFVEAAGKFLDDAETWQSIASALQPRGLGAAVSSRGTSPSAALVTFDAESLKLTPDERTMLARRLRARLIDISKTIGVNLPVYVLFTRMDRVSFFWDYTRNLTGGESSQYLGSPVEAAANSAGPYAQTETTRLGLKLDALLQSLCAWRLPLLDRETAPDKLPGAYQFPREMKKLRENTVQFLVDLCRPSEMTEGPFLRGFYFSGIRPVEVTGALQTEAAVAGRGGNASDASVPGTGTTVFRPGQTTAPKVAASVPSSRRVPQWIFVRDFFQTVLLSDQGAKEASGTSTKTFFLRRALLLAACALCLFYGVALTWSFVRNHSLRKAVTETASQIEAPGETGPTLDSLRYLEALRQRVAELGAYNEDSPLGIQWGLNTARDIYPVAWRIYFDKFRSLLLSPTQTAMVEGMRNLPAAPGPGSPEYSPTYDSLKGYLMTTSNPDKSARAFLSPVLTSRWSAIRKVEAEKVQLAQKQFDFYSDQLKIRNPFIGDNDEAAISRSRHFLNQFAGLERVYAAMLADAGKNSPPVNFNRKFPGSSETVVGAYEVPGAFAKSGWDEMRKSLKQPERYFNGEEWVLGKHDSGTIDATQMAAQLDKRYSSDFIKQWRNYLRAAVVVKYANLADAAKKLNATAGNSSPLLALLSLASQNTAVDVPEVANVFQSVQTLVPANAPAFIGPVNQPYMTAMLQLQTTVEAASQAPDPLDDKVATPTLASASAAHIAAKQIGQTFRPDAEGSIDRTVEKLMEDPITNVEALLKRLGPAELNAGGQNFCGQYRKLFARYPFSSNPAAVPATVAEVNAVFHPGDGALWAFYDSSLKKLLVKQGGQYKQAQSGGAVAITEPFLKFFNDAAALSEAWYEGNSDTPHFTYTLRPQQVDDIQNVGVSIDGQTLSYTAGGGLTEKRLSWQAKDQNDVKATVRLGNSPDLTWSNNQGAWAVFQFFGKAENSRPAGEMETLEWIIRIGKDPVTLPNGKPLTVRLDLGMNGAPPVFRKGYLAGLGCISTVAKAP